MPRKRIVSVKDPYAFITANIEWHARSCGADHERLAVAAHVSSSTLYSRFRHPQDWRLEELQRLALFFDVPLTVLVEKNSFGKGERPR